jgi:hypothetical protein
MQNHELQKLLSFINLPSIRYSIIAAENDLRLELTWHFTFCWKWEGAVPVTYLFLGVLGVEPRTLPLLSHSPRPGHFFLTATGAFTVP